MRTATMIVAAVAAGVVGAGAVVTPVVLATNDDHEPMGSGPPWADADGPGAGRGPMFDRGGRGAGPGQQMGPGGSGGMGPGMGSRGGFGDGPGMDPGHRQSVREGGCEPLLAGVPSGTLTEAQEKTLVEQAEHEKVALDVYTVFADETGDRRFERIAQSEARHLEALRTLLDRYELDDPTQGREQGQFESGTAEQAYGDYVEEGSGSLRAALEVAREIEREDIADLDAAAEGLDAPDVERVYEQQATASQMHLAVFSR